MAKRDPLGLERVEELRRGRSSTASSARPLPRGTIADDTAPLRQHGGVRRDLTKFLRGVTFLRSTHGHAPSPG